MEGACRVTGRPGRGERAEGERATDVDDRHRRRQSSPERGGQLHHRGIRYRQESNLGRPDHLRRFAPRDELAVVAGRAEGSGERAPEAPAADDQEVDCGCG